MQDELNKLRAESKSMKQRLKQETDAKKNWQDISRKREEDLQAFKQQLITVTKEVDTEKAAHAKTQTGLHLKTERLRIAEMQNKLLSQKLGEQPASPKKVPTSRRKNQPSYEQPTFIVTEDELAKTGGKESIFAQLRKKGEVAFPERRSPDPSEVPQLSRIDQLRQQKQENSMKTSFMNSTKKKVMF